MATCPCGGSVHGQDGGVRSARIKTANRVFHRPITKICLLEEGSDDK